MARMVRKQVCISAELDERLKRRARQLRTTESDLIRRSIDQMLDYPGARALDDQVLRDVMAYLRRQDEIAFARQQRGWTREDAYEERLRWPR